MCVVALLCPEDTVSISSGTYILSASFSVWYLDFGRKRYGIYAPFRAENSAAFLSSCRPVVGLCVNHYLLKIEAFLVKIERGNNL